jgi:hypothetical protein
MPDVKPEIKERFDSLYAEWEERIKDPKIQLSSRPRDYIDNEPYREIVKLGKEALPMILEKIEAGIFFMNQAALETAGLSLEEIVKEESELPGEKRLDFAKPKMPQFLSEGEKSKLILKRLRTPRK